MSRDTSVGPPLIDEAAKAHQPAAEFFEEHDEPGKAEREHHLANFEAQEAETERREAAVRQEDLAPDP